MANLLYQQQYFKTTLNAPVDITNSPSDIDNFILTDISGIEDVTKPGEICLTFSDPLDRNYAEYIEFTSINPATKKLNGVTRAVSGFVIKTHSRNAPIAFIHTKEHINRINDKLLGIDGGVTLTSPVVKGSVDGWVDANETWTYASATTITVPTDATTKYQTGDKIRLVQSGTTKYFYVVSVAVTTLTVSGGNNYALTNTAITGNSYSKAVTPQGFPSYFPFTPSWTSSGTAPAIGNGFLLGYFTILGKLVTCEWLWVAGSTTTFGTGFYFFGLPFTALSTDVLGGSYGIGSSGASMYTFVPNIDTVNRIGIFFGSPAANVQATVPAAFVNGNYMKLSLTYLLP